MVAAELIYMEDKSQYIVPDTVALRSAQSHSHMMIMLAKQYSELLQYVKVNGTEGKEYLHIVSRTSTLEPIMSFSVKNNEMAILDNHLT